MDAEKSWKFLQRMKQALEGKDIKEIKSLQEETRNLSGPISKDVTSMLEKLQATSN